MNKSFTKAHSTGKINRPCCSKILWSHPLFFIKRSCDKRKNISVQDILCCYFGNNVTLALGLFTSLNIGPAWSAFAEPAELIGIILKYACAVIVPPGSLTLTVNHAGCRSVFNRDCCTWSVIRLSAKHRRRQTALIVAVFISSYITRLTFFFVGICVFIAGNGQLLVNINFVSMATPHCHASVPLPAIDWFVQALSPARTAR